MESDIINTWGWQLEPWNYPRPDDLDYASVEPEPSGPDSGGVLFADLLLEWLAGKRGDLQGPTFQNYEQVVRGKIEPFFRKKLTLVSEMTEDIISEFYYGKENDNENQVNTVKANTIAHYHTYIKQTLDLAVKKGLLKFNPATIVKKPRKDTFIAEVYTEQEVDGLFSAFRFDPLFVPVVIGIYCGLRKSEIIGLEWDAINFRSKTIALKQVAYKHKEYGKKVEQRIKHEMKSKSSFRTMPLPSEVEEVLQWWKREIKKNIRKHGANYNHTYDKFVCVHENGDWIKLGYANSHFKLVLETNGLRAIRFHDLRHSCASILFNNGAQQRDIKDYLGHAHISTTDRYTHTNYSHKLPTARRVSQVLPNPLV